MQRLFSHHLRFLFFFFFGGLINIPDPKPTMGNFSHLAVGGTLLGGWSPPCKGPHNEPPIYPLLSLRRVVSVEFGPQPWPPCSWLSLNQQVEAHAVEGICIAVGIGGLSNQQFCIWLRSSQLVPSWGLRPSTVCPPEHSLRTVMLSWSKANLLDIERWKPPRSLFSGKSRQAPLVAFLFRSNRYPQLMRALPKKRPGQWPCLRLA